MKKLFALLFFFSFQPVALGAEFCNRLLAPSEVTEVALWQSQQVSIHYLIFSRDPSTGNVLSSLPYTRTFLSSALSLNDLPGPYDRWRGGDDPLGYQTPKNSYMISAIEFICTNPRP